MNDEAGTERSSAKKIGLLTHPLAENYGGILQATALYSYLRSKGYDVYLLRRHRNKPKWKRLAISVIEKIPFQNYNNYRYLLKKSKIQKDFIDTYIPNKTSIVYNTQELEKIADEEKFDAVIVGSDQVWRMSFVDDGHYGNYFLDFVKTPGTKKIAYAASFGVDYWEAPEKVELVREMVGGFTAISVREQSGIEICREIFERCDAQLALDPTLLIDKTFYDNFSSNKSITKKQQILTYVLDESSEKKEVVNQILSMHEGGYSLKNILGDMDNIFSAAEWVDAIRNADFIVTDSFHGMVFSIIFNKNFIAVGNKKRGVARFQSLTNLLGLSHRVITDVENISYELIDDIDYSVVNERVAELRRRSELFLERSLI